MTPVRAAASGPILRLNVARPSRAEAHSYHFWSLSSLTPNWSRHISALNSETNHWKRFCCSTTGFILCYHAIIRALETTCCWLRAKRLPDIIVYTAGRFEQNVVNWEAESHSDHRFGVHIRCTTRDIGAVSVPSHLFRPSQRLMRTSSR